MARFRIAQISDLHFGHTADWTNPTEGPVADTTLRKARAAVEALIKNRFKGGVGSILYPSTFSADMAQSLLIELDRSLFNLDAIVITGDLATTGEEGDLILARQYLEGKVPEDWNPLGGLPSLVSRACPVVTLPGNHDRYDGKALLPMSRRFEGIFGDAWDLGNGTVVSSPSYGDRVRLLPLAKSDGALVICMADLSLDGAHAGEGGFGWIGQGRVTDTVVDAMTRATQNAVEDAGIDGLPTAAIWAVHFPPLYPGVDPSLRLLDESILVEAAHRARVSAILAGHTHEALTYELAPSQGEGNVPVYCCGSSTGVSKNGQYTYTVFEVDTSNGAGVNATNFVWNPGTESFVGSAFPAA